jgi:hypothetical protein
LCSTWKWAVAWDLREMGSEWEEGVRAGLSRLRQSMPNKGRDNMEKDEKEQSNWALWRRIGANRVDSQLIKLSFYKRDWGVLILIVVFFSFRRINHIA